MADPSIIIQAGPHARRACPVEFRLPRTPSAGGQRLASGDGASIALQTGPDGTARCIVPAIGPGESLSLRVEPMPDNSDAPVSVRDTGGAIEITAGGELVTRYVYADVPARPYFYPLLAPGQIQVTRAYPMTPDAPGETRDHPHHRSLWIAHGEVNDADNWSEEEGHACTRHESIDSLNSGPVAGTFSTRSTWVRPDGAPLLTQHLSVTAWNTDGDLRILDFRIGLEARFGAVRFGDTKEGGILSVRLASALDVPRGGRITNVYGGIDEAETWGKAAHWCDYSGAVDGQRVGIAVFDHPHSFRYPTHWHVRNYGLMTANPFAYNAYTGGVKDGSHTLADGATLDFRYRVLVHRGDCAEADVAGRYLDYVAPPTVTIDAG